MYSIRATFLNLVRKGHHTWLNCIDDWVTVKITGSKRPVWALCASLVPELLKNAFLFAVNKNQVSISMVEVFSIQDLYMPKNSDFLTKTTFWLINRHIAQTLNAPNPYPTMHHFVTELSWKWCIVGYLSYALWNLWDGWLTVISLI